MGGKLEAQVINYADAAGMLYEAFYVSSRRKKVLRRVEQEDIPEASIAIVK